MVTVEKEALATPRASRPPLKHLTNFKLHSVSGPLSDLRLSRATSLSVCQIEHQLICSRTSACASFWKPDTLFSGLNRLQTEASFEPLCKIQISTSTQHSCNMTQHETKQARHKKSYSFMFEPV